MRWEGRGRRRRGGEGREKVGRGGEERAPQVNEQLKSPRPRHTHRHPNLSTSSSRAPARLAQAYAAVDILCPFWKQSLVARRNSARNWRAQIAGQSWWGSLCLIKYWSFGRFVALTGKNRSDPKVLLFLIERNFFFTGSLRFVSCE